MKVFWKYLLILALLGAAQSALWAQEKARQHLIAAREYMRAGQLQPARQELDSALQLSPRDPRINALLGDWYLAQGNKLSALFYYDKAILYGLNTPGIYHKRALLHDELNNHPDYVIRDFDRALALAPDSLGYYLDKARYLAGHTNPATRKPYFEEAAATITAALARFPEAANLYFLRSQYLFGDGQSLAALADISRAIQLDPEVAAYPAQRGYIHFMIGNYREAVSNYARALRLDPDNPEYYQFRGHARQNLGDYEKAYDDYSKAIDLVIEEITTTRQRLQPEHPLNRQLRSLLLFRGISLVHANRPYDGCQDFERAWQMGEGKARNYMRQYCN